VIARRVVRVRRQDCRGLGIIELLVAAAILAAMIVVALPALSGYQNTSAMQTTARQFVSDLRAAQARAVGQSAQIDLIFTVSGGAVTGYNVQQGTTVLWGTTFPSSVHASSTWPGNDIGFTSIGAVTGQGATPALCVDNKNGLTETVSITLATGRSLLAGGTGSC
jgi:type II secretory pathway pseudopilin PulG